MSFEESLEQNSIPDLTSAEPTNYSLYERWLRQYFERFPREHILVTSYDHFKTDPKDYLERMVAFLELPEDAPMRPPIQFRTCQDYGTHHSLFHPRSVG